MLKTTLLHYFYSSAHFTRQYSMWVWICSARQLSWAKLVLHCRHSGIETKVTKFMMELVKRGQCPFRGLLMGDGSSTLNHKTIKLSGTQWLLGNTTGHKTCTSRTQILSSFLVKFYDGLPKLANTFLACCVCFICEYCYLLHYLH